jgi:(1->4)-alpha-D-glucan 1-alpha-D-glucosylmutase
MRARLAVLSEFPSEWGAALRAWSTLNQPHRRNDVVGAGASHAVDWSPGPMAEAMLYQTLVGCWPPDLDPGDEAGVRALAERVAQWQLKALREAKLRTNWLAPDTTYESDCKAFLFDILAPQRRDGFLDALAGFVARVAPPGALNALLQTTLRLTSPGVPDLYQGTELWDFSLVEPDNRRPVDHAARAATLDDAPPTAKLAHWRDAQVKLAVVRRLLALRSRAPELLREGSYLPLEVRGARAQHAIAFARRRGDACAVIVGTRLAATLIDGDLPLVAPERWDDTAIALPKDWNVPQWQDWLSDSVRIADGENALYLRDVLATMPVAVLSNLAPHAPPSAG